MHILIVGAGSAGERHLRNFLCLDGVHCSIAETDTSRREKIAARYPLQAAYSGYREALANKFDAAVICIPADLHIPVASEIVETGIHVLLEKPLAMTMDGVDGLKRLLDKKKTVFSIAYTLRSDPLFRELRERAINGEAGSILLVNFYAGQYWPNMRQDYPPRYAQSRSTGGGAIPDHLIHMINFLEWCFGSPREVSARHWRLGLPDIATEDTAYLVLNFASGVVAFLGICLFQHDTNMRVQMIGEGTTIQLRAEADYLEIFNRGDGNWRTGTNKKLDREMVFREQARHFIECIKGRETPRCTLAEAEQTLQTMLAALHSGDSGGRPVKPG
jgi:predicted dehydrogenase